MDSIEMNENDALSGITNGVNDVSAIDEDKSSTSETTPKQIVDHSGAEVPPEDNEMDNPTVSESENEVSLMSVGSELNETTDPEESIIVTDEVNDSEMQNILDKKMCNIKENAEAVPHKKSNDGKDQEEAKESAQVNAKENGTESIKTKNISALLSAKKAAEANTNLAVSSTKEDAESVVKTESKSKKDKKKSKNCAECGKKGKKFRLHFQGQNHNLCSEDCYKNFKIKLASGKSPSTTTNSPAEPGGIKCMLCAQDVTSGYYPTVGEIKPLCSEDCVRRYQNDNAPPMDCSQCKQKISDLEKQLLWEMMNFCGEMCLDKYQSYLGSHCTCCQQPVQQPSLGKYCVCFGADIRQFCSGTCLEEFKKGLKVCTFCQTDLSTASDGFLAPVGEKGQFKDFCSPKCMERFETSNSISKTPLETQDCANCKKQGTYTTRVTYNNNQYFLCCDNCVSGFRHTYKIKDNMCDTCFNFFTPDSEKAFSFKMDNVRRFFCSKPCSTIYVLSHRKITQCVQCKVKKYNTDMIEKADSLGTANMFCSLNCLSLFRVNASASSGKCVRCDHCGKTSPAQYHLTMSDGSIRNFCNYGCVMSFQNQFTSVPALTSASSSRQQSTVIPKLGVKTSVASSPVIANVISLSTPTNSAKNLVPQTLVRPQTLSALSPKPQQTSVTSGNSSPSTPRGGGPVPREVIVRPPAPKALKNKTVSCKPIMQTKGVSAKLQTCHKAVQTDDSPTPIFLPIPVPVYVPTPLHMFSRPVPCPVPFPVPIPIPVLVPIKETSSTTSPAPPLSQDSRVHATRPYDVDLLKMPDLTDSAHPKDRSSAESGIKLLSDICPEKILPISRIKEEILSDPSGNEREIGIASDEDFIMRGEGRKRTGSSHIEEDMDYKRSRQDDIPPMDSQNTIYKDPFSEEPEQNLKSAYGVNAWQQWVDRKNERMNNKGTARKFKNFKTDLLAYSNQELNYSLTMFVREIRRESGQEYTAATLYFLTLAIQLYLIENGRLEDIFFESQFSKFSQCLHDIFLEREAQANVEGIALAKIDEHYLWQARQLGAWSPFSLVQTLVYTFAVNFYLWRVDELHNMRFSHIHRKVIDEGGGELRVYLEYKPPHGPKRTLTIEGDIASNKCPVKLYDFYCHVCPEGFAKKDVPLFLCPVIDEESEDWFSSERLGRDILAKILQRMKVIRETTCQRVNSRRNLYPHPEHTCCCHCPLRMNE